MPTQQSDVLELKVRIEAKRVTVFEFFTDPAKIRLWKGQGATVESIPGGIYRLDVNGRDVARASTLRSRRRRALCTHGDGG